MILFSVLVLHKVNCLYWDSLVLLVERSKSKFKRILNSWLVGI